MMVQLIHCNLLEVCWFSGEPFVKLLHFVYTHSKTLAEVRSHQQHQRWVSNQVHVASGRHNRQTFFWCLVPVKLSPRCQAEKMHMSGPWPPLPVLEKCWLKACWNTLQQHHPFPTHVCRLDLSIQHHPEAPQFDMHDTHDMHHIEKLSTTLAFGRCGHIRLFPLCLLSCQEKFKHLANKVELHIHSSKEIEFLNLPIFADFGSSKADHLYLSNSCVKSMRNQHCDIKFRDMPCLLTRTCLTSMDRQRIHLFQQQKVAQKCGWDRNVSSLLALGWFLWDNFWMAKCKRLFTMSHLDISCFELVMSIVSFPTACWLNRIRVVVFLVLLCLFTTIALWWIVNQWIVPKFCA